MKKEGGSRAEATVIIIAIKNLSHGGGGEAKATITFIATKDLSTWEAIGKRLWPHSSQSKTFSWGWQ